MLFSFILLSILLFRFLTIQNYRLHTFAFKPIIIGLFASFNRFISCAAMHIISVLPVPQAKRKVRNHMRIWNLPKRSPPNRTYSSPSIRLSMFIISLFSSMNLAVTVFTYCQSLSFASNHEFFPFLLAFQVL